VFAKGVVLGTFLGLYVCLKRQESVFDFMFLKSRKEENLLFFKGFKNGRRM